MPSIAERNKETVRAFLRALEAKDCDAVAGLFAEDGVHINPYHSDLFPKGAEGREAIRDYWRPPFSTFGDFAFTMHDIHATETGDMVIAHFSGRIERLDGADLYENEYYAPFKFNEAGEITEYVEIFNPITAGRAFGLL